MASAADCTCPVCMELLDDPVVMPCKHELCHACFKLHVTITSLHCPICRLRLASWMRRSISAGTLIDQKRSEEIKKFRAQLVQSEDAGSLSSSLSTSSTSRAEHLVRISMPGEVHAEYVAEKLKLQAELEEQRRQEEAASEALIKQLMDEDKKEAEQQKLKEAAATKAYLKRVLRSEVETFPASSYSTTAAFRPVCDSTLAFGNFASRPASTVSSCSGRDGEGPSTSGCATKTGQEEQAPAARACTESSSSAGSSAAVSSVNVVSNSGAACNAALLQHLDSDAEQGSDVPSLLPAAISARSPLSARGKSAILGRGRSRMPRLSVACSPERISRRISRRLDSGSPSRQSRSRSPIIDRQSETATPTHCRGRKVLRGRHFSSPRSSVASTFNAPAFQPGRRRGSRGSGGLRSISQSPISWMSTFTASRVGSHWRRSSHKYGSRTRGGLASRRGRGGSARRGGSQIREGSRLSRAQPPEARASRGPAFRSGRPRGRRSSQIHTSMSRAPEAAVPSPTASRLCRGSKRGRRGYSRGKCRSAYVPQSPTTNARSPSAPRSRIDCRHCEASASALHRGRSRSRWHRGCKSSTPACTHGCSGGHSSASPLPPRASTVSLVGSSAAGGPDLLIAETELTAPPDEAAEAATAAGEAARPAAESALSPECSQRPQSDAEIARHLQSLYNLEHKYKLNGLRFPESEGEYGLRSRSGRKDRGTCFTTVAAPAADSSGAFFTTVAASAADSTGATGGSCRQSGSRPSSPSSLQPPAEAAYCASDPAPVL